MTSLIEQFQMAFDDKLCTGLAGLFVLLIILAIALPDIIGISFLQFLSLVNTFESLQNNSTFAPGNVSVLRTNFQIFVSCQFIALFLALGVLVLNGLRLQGRELQSWQNPGGYAILAAILVVGPAAYLSVAIFGGALAGLFLQSSGVVCALVAFLLGCIMGSAECCCNAQGERFRDTPKEGTVV